MYGRQKNSSPYTKKRDSLAQDVENRKTAGIGGLSKC